MSDWQTRYEGAAMVLLAVVCGVAGGFEADDLRALRERGEVVPAVVLDKSGGRTEHITVRYVTKSGQTIEGDTSNFLDAEVGQTVDVVYDRTDPHRMQAADWGTDYTMPILWAVGFAIFLAVGARLLWSAR
ncbi:DUF3592 domain-containing protein [Kribbella sp. NPDC051770]|uniref:DUF3592 domain-containing protein n=1 Tax=Kribbella sp. NPDC051770 TaxID=3155413 RepID=UPI00344A9512